MYIFQYIYRDAIDNMTRWPFKSIHVTSRDCKIGQTKELRHSDMPQLCIHSPTYWSRCSRRQEDREALGKRWWSSSRRRLWTRSASIAAVEQTWAMDIFFDFLYIHRTLMNMDTAWLVELIVDNMIDTPIGRWCQTPPSAPVRPSSLPQQQPPFQTITRFASC